LKIYNINTINFINYKDHFIANPDSGIYASMMDPNSLSSASLKSPVSLILPIKAEWLFLM